ncbi:hypothetical protein [Haloglomus litoreum]|uniref:hypothetical protein n=1 Tax=Haloglomus litoreum TaxID=3034026 RepID=UPI0023E8006D|nr:hypothetical protein [Haloglomus sp. DT116]
MDEGEPGRGGRGSDDGERDRLVAAVREALAPETYDRFNERVAEQADRVAEDCAAGRLDNEDYAVGLELEAYTVDGRAQLCHVPEGAPEDGGFAPELGRHNLEVNTPPDVLSPAGLDRQFQRLHDAVADAREAIAAAGAADREGAAERDDGAARDGTDDPRAGQVRPVLDAMWSVPPATGTSVYLSAGEARDGVWLAANMTRNARYHALDADTLRRMDNGIPLDVPGADHRLPSILVESLATSVQPHLQVPAAADVGRYLRYATRILGPAVALTANSPFLPADLYPEAVDAEAVLSGPHELRVPVYEDSINPPGIEKVRVPADVADAEEAVRAIEADETFAPFCTDPEDVADDDPYRQRFPEFAHKHGTFWRWVRPVFGGDTPSDGDGPSNGNDDRSVRLEFRPVPTQPTVRDCVSVQAMVAGALRGLDATDHPLLELPWADARDSFYNAVAEGPGADLPWITAEGDRTDNPDIALDELLSLARTGLEEAGFPGTEIDRWIAPLEARQVAAITPSVWKKHRVRAGMNHGESFHEAVEAMQWEYIELSEATDSFTQWI